MIFMAGTLPQLIGTNEFYLSLSIKPRDLGSYAARARRRHRRFRPIVAGLLLVMDGITHSLLP